MFLQSIFLTEIIKFPLFRDGVSSVLCGKPHAISLSSATAFGFSKLHLKLHLHLDIYIYICIYVYICIYLSLSVSISISFYLSTYLYIYIYIHVYIHVNPVTFQNHNLFLPPTISIMGSGGVVC